MPEIWVVVCRGSAGEVFRIHIVADTVEEAIDEARQRGHVVDQAEPVTGRSSNPDAAVQPLAHRKSECRRCGYTLKGLPPLDGCVTCPECGAANLA